MTSLTIELDDTTVAELLEHYDGIHYALINEVEWNGRLALDSLVVRVVNAALDKAESEETDG